VAADPYETLGVKRDATQDEIRAAYRKLAKTLHPDLNPGDRAAEERFKTVAGAYDLLSDAEKRARFDRGEIDASGAERPQQRYYRDFQDFAAGEHPYSGAGGHADFADMDDLLGGLFGRARGGRSQFRMRGADARYRLPVEFLEAVGGATKRITLPDGATLDVAIPPGTADGQVLRLRGKGLEGAGGGPAGDALIEIEVRPHRSFNRKGDDIELELPVSLHEAVLGAKLDVPTPAGPVRMSVPPGSNSGTRLRLKGKGAPKPGGGRGDQYVTLRLMLPEGRDETLEALLRNWPAGERHNPRQGMEEQG